jgi:Leu/Phe-tRNA-protein transferase
MVSPDPRAILPTHRLHIPRRLWRVWKQKPFRITADTAFASNSRLRPNTA